MNISVKHLKLSIGDFAILNGLSLDAPDAQFTCIVGPNGSGKSSILRVISKDVTDYSGFVTDIGQSEMAYLPQDIQPPPFLNTFDIVNLGFYGQVITGDERKFATEELLDTCGIKHIKHHPFTNISSGERQRGWLAFALAQAKELILMDEPLGAVDTTSRASFFKLLRNIVDKGKTLILVTHDVDLAIEYSDHLIALQNGRKLFEGDPAQYKPAIL